MSDCCLILFSDMYPVNLPRNAFMEREANRRRHVTPTSEIGRKGAGIQILLNKGVFVILSGIQIYLVMCSCEMALSKACGSAHTSSCQRQRMGLGATQAEDYINYLELTRGQKRICLWEQQNPQTLTPLNPKSQQTNKLF